MPIPQPSDHAARQRAIHERARNVVVDAGAGTGKTRLIVDRLVELVAPGDDAVEPLALGRIAVLTFTRKAAGELRFRVREAFLRHLGGQTLSDSRRQRLRRALEQLDPAFIGTIHSFADRLLRLRPIEARLSPQYRIVENAMPLLRETFWLLMRCAEAGSLAEAIAGPDLHALAAEAQQTLHDFEHAGLRVETTEYQSGINSPAGLDKFVQDLLDSRDVPAAVGAEPPPAPDLATVRAALVSHINRVGNLVIGRGYGSDWLRDRARELAAAVDCDDPVEVLRIVQGVLGRKPPDLTRRRDFPGDNDGWDTWKDFWGKGKPLDSGIGQAVRPLHDWLGRRLARLGPVILDLYTQVKARHEVVDYLDLLLELRDLLHQPRLQRFYAGLFDHVLIDEFQDTDPVQAEILFYLCSDVPEAAADWRLLRPTPGRLTLVGDPQQSIYRFRRADIQVYHDACARLEGACRETLQVNFRSQPALIDFFNHSLQVVLGRDPHDPGRRFDHEGCRAYYHDLCPSPLFENGVSTAARPVAAAPAAAAPAAHGDRTEVLHELVYDVPDWRPHHGREADALARHLWWLASESEICIRDPDATTPQAARAIGYGDIAVLTRRTTYLPALFEALDRFGIPYAARGGNVFLRQPVVVQFILGLRGLSDRSDGAAQAALHAPPFFAIEPRDVAVRSPAFEQAKAVIDDIRRKRFSRSPAASALALLERSAFARSVALTPNGERRLAAARELLGHIDALAHERQLAFDGVTAELRKWLADPERIIDQAAPVEATAVQILTTYQAKGLEFPVVALWDATDKLQEKDIRNAWLVDRNTAAWRIKLQNFVAHGAGATAASGTAANPPAPAASDVEDVEARFYGAERRRLLYVAATRARDLLIVPAPRREKDGASADPEKYACAAVLYGAGQPPAPGAATQATPALAADIVRACTPCAHAEAVPEFPEVLADPAEAARSEQAIEWLEARDAARRPQARPGFITEHASRAAGGAVVEAVEIPAAPTEAEPPPHEVQLDLFVAAPPTTAGDGASTTAAASSAAVTAPPADDAPEHLPDLPDDETSRHGRHFGTAVHAALQWILSGRPEPARELVERACRLSGLADAALVDQAAADVARALATLRAQDLLGNSAVRLYAEYPVLFAPPDERGLLLRGSIDLLVQAAGQQHVIDFKTDAPEARERLSRYVGQVRSYEDALAAASSATAPATTRAGLLFTASGQLEAIRAL